MLDFFVRQKKRKGIAFLNCKIGLLLWGFRNVFSSKISMCKEDFFLLFRGSEKWKKIHWLSITFSQHPQQVFGYFRSMKWKKYK
jgi:hypothetical protein